MTAWAVGKFWVGQGLVFLGGVICTISIRKMILKKGA